MCRRVRRWSICIMAVVVVVGLAACGGGSGGGSTSAANPRAAGPGRAGAGAARTGNPSAVVARVGGSVITAAMVNRWWGIEERREKLAPPQFAGCVAQLRVALRASVAGTSAANTAESSVAQLRESCEALDQQLRNEALYRYVVADWTIGGARELGVDVNGQAFQRRFAALIKQTFHTQAHFHSYLASVGRDEADIKFQVHKALDENAIRQAIKRRVGPLTAAGVRRYYEQHKRQYFFQQTRDLEIAATPTRTASLAVRRKIASGESFASVVAGLHSPQAVLSAKGFVSDLPSGYYKEPTLNHAIFTSKPGVLLGPIQTVIGYFIVRVKKIHPAYQQPLSAVAASIRSMLPAQRQEGALVAYIKKWRAKWTAQTNCSAGYVLPKCKQFHGPLDPREHDPYTLN